MRLFMQNYTKNAGLKGGHVILLNGKDSEYYEATRNQALKALRAYPGGSRSEAVSARKTRRTI